MQTLVLAIGLVAVFFPAIAQANLSEVEAAVMDKNFEQARQMSTRLIKSTTDPKEKSQLEYYLGLSHLRLGQYAQARKIFGMVMHDTRDEKLYENAALGLVEGYQMAGFFKDALAEAQKLLRKYPQSSSKSLIYLKMARAHLRLMQWSQARKYLNKIVSEYPDSFEAPLAKTLLDEKEYFTVQVGSFLDKTLALKLADELKSKDQYAYIVQMEASDGSVFYRVRVGQMTSLADAQSLETKLSSQGYPTLIYP